LPILVGMGVHCLSLNPQSIPGIKKVLRSLSYKECAALLEEVLQSDSVTWNNKLIRETIFKKFPDELMFYSSMLEREEE
ncbi:MAG: phosphoenolpyruvate--protein phosphotransferase, partial [Desulfohalobiaceae bacterium]|nr:phosphoenolpyruvate--protein phosphotransferase [Desulfohalobiaceae bacterium]